MSAVQNLPMPPDEVMTALLAIAIGGDLALQPETGRVAVLMEDGHSYVIEGDDLDPLFERQWIEADDAARRVTTTPAGRYWVERWLARQPKRGPRRAHHPFKRFRRSR